MRDKVTSVQLLEGVLEPNSMDRFEKIILCKRSDPIIHIHLNFALDLPFETLNQT